MRKYTILKETVPMNHSGAVVKKIMIYSHKKEGAFLFLFETTDEYSGCSADLWFQDVKEAEECAVEDYGVNPEDWIMIDDPLPDCQHDMIHPIRIKGRNSGNPKWGELEIFDGTKWVDITGVKY